MNKFERTVYGNIDGIRFSYSTQGPKLHADDLKKSPDRAIQDAGYGDIDNDGDGWVSDGEFARGNWGQETSKKFFDLARQARWKGNALLWSEINKAPVEESPYQALDQTIAWDKTGSCLRKEWLSDSDVERLVTLIKAGQPQFQCVLLGGGVDGVYTFQRNSESGKYEVTSFKPDYYGPH